MNFKEIEEKYEFDVYPKRNLVLLKGKGAKVFDEKGNEYIDCVAGVGVANLGHCNEEVAKAIAKQSKELITCYGMFYNDKKALFVEKLVKISPKSLTKAFLCSTGSESIEAALKFARFTTGKTDFVSAMRGYHGRTMGALSASFNPKYRKEFMPLVPGFSFVPYNNFEKLQEAVTDKTAGIVLEIVQGEGGVILGDKEYFEKVRKLCDEKNILLIIDEVQTGLCRTGKMFACDHFNLQPDIMCVAKSLAGGVPMGATLCSDKIKIPLGRHGTTFGGNPLACAAGIASLDYMAKNDLAKQAQEKGKYLMKKLKNIKSDKVREIRGLGLMIGIELKEKAKPYSIELMKKGILVLLAGSTTLRLLPPLTISNVELDQVAKAITEVLN